MNVSHIIIDLLFIFSHRPPVREMWRKMCHLWFVCATVHSCANLRWMQLRLIPGTMCDLWRTRRIRCLLLQRMHNSRERCELAVTINQFCINSKLCLCLLLFRETAVQRLSIWVALKRTYSTKGRNMGLNRDSSGLLSTCGQTSMRFFFSFHSN